MACISRCAAVLGLAVVTLHLEAVSASLLRTSPLANVAPVVQFHEQQAVSQKSGQWALKGVPTHYEPSGCKRVVKAYNKASSEFTASMSIGRCFAFCSQKKGLTYFGLQKGNNCFCAKAIDATPMDSASCDSPCSGDAQDMCGGIEGTNVYVMIDCTPATAAEKTAEAAEDKKALISSYGEREGQTCGTDAKNVLQLDNKGFLAGSVDTCKVACWEGKGAENCHGFTYDSTMQKCTFHYDVNSGTVTSKADKACYFKVTR